jgi:phosphatidylglycerol:prolipoprotein diacylglycerol transferase
MIALGFFAALATVRKLAVANRLNPERMADFTFWFLLVGFLGARALFVITRWSDFVADPIAIFRIWEGGLVFFGAPLAAIPYALWMLKREKISPWVGLDVFLPALTIAHAIGRVGCLAAGCCYGTPTDLPWGIRLTSELVDSSHRGIPLHPVQLYESTSLVILYFGLLWIHRHRKFEGQVGLVYLMTYPILRSILEEFRGDSIRGFVIDGVLSTSQFISILVFCAGLVTCWIRLHGLKVKASK